MEKLSKIKLQNPHLISSSQEASLYLASTNSTMFPIVDKYGLCELKWRKDRKSHFSTLVETICFQQLAGRAARTIHDRLIEAVGGKINLESISRTSDSKMREAGLSANKVASIRSLVEKIETGDLKLRNLSKMSDDDVVEHLIQVRGIGPWSAHMFLMERLARLDIWPTGDYGVRVGITKILNLNDTPTEKQCLTLGAFCKPFRSVLAWYCWRCADDKD